MPAGFRIPAPWRRADSLAVALLIAALVAAGSAAFIFKFRPAPASDSLMYLANADAVQGLQKGAMTGFHLRYVGYSALIALGRKTLGAGPTGLLCMNLVLHVGAALLLWGLVKRRSAHPLAPPAAMLLAGLYPLALYTTGLLLTETLFAFLLAALALCLCALLRRPTAAAWGGYAATGLLLCLTRPTGEVVMLSASVLCGAYLLVRRRGAGRALGLWVWAPLFWCASQVFFQVFVTEPAPAPAAAAAVGAAPREAPASFPEYWLLVNTFVTPDGNHYDATRSRQADFARRVPSTPRISDFMHAQRAELEAGILAAARAAHPAAASAATLGGLPGSVTRALLVDNLRRHPVHVAGHFLKNAFWNMWFTRDNLRHTGLLVALNLPYVLLGAAGWLLLARRRRWDEAVVLAALLLPIWGVHTAIYAISRYALPLIPLLVLSGALGLSAPRLSAGPGGAGA